MSFPTKTIREVTETLIDYRGKTPTKTASGIKLITAKVIKDGFIVDGDHEYIAADQYDSWMRRGLPQQWDILITTEAPLGEVAQLRTPEKVALAQRVILLRGNSSMIDQAYYFHALRSPVVQARLKARSSGTTVLGIKQSELWNVEIPCPPLETQRRVASILSAFDDLIDNNTRRIGVLEQMAQMLYREWFVNFRFPGHEKYKMVESELGAIPEGWSVRSLDTLMDFQGGSQPPKSEWSKEPLPGYVRMIQIRDYESDNHIAYVEDSKQLRKCSEPDIMIARYGASVARICGGLTGAYNVALVRVLPLIRGAREFLRSFLMSDRFQSLLIGMSGRTAQAGFNKSVLQAIKTPFPHDKELLERYEETASPMRQMHLVLKRASTNLKATRDLLLPKLVSGEIRVEGIETETASQSV